MSIARKPYPSGVSDDEWELVAPYLTLLSESPFENEVSRFMHLQAPERGAEWW